MPGTPQRETKEPTRSRRHQSSPEELSFVARTWVVSWLRAARLAFPTVDWSVAC